MNTLIPDVRLLGDGKKRFSELRRSMEDISQRMLTRLSEPIFR
ncbi:MAG: hypothetical protein DMG76_33860 [Acidobacteria bacterium]|nr:MAG: hypothetical protein DMG76_33860 [Acidobacteriota bacterium]